jgi:hypothetical protein
MYNVSIRTKGDTQMATKRQIVAEVFKILENEENCKRLKDNYHYMKFLGLNWDYSQAKYSMACDYNKFTSFEYKNMLDKIKTAIA